MLHLLHIFVLVFSSITLHFSLLPCLQAICTSQVVSRRSWSPEEEKTLPLSPSRSRYSTPANSSATASSSVTASATSPLWCPSDVMWGERYLASLSVLPPLSLPSHLSSPSPTPFLVSLCQSLLSLLPSLSPSLLNRGQHSRKRGCTLWAKLGSEIRSISIILIFISPRPRLSLSIPAVPRGRATGSTGCLGPLCPPRNRLYGYNWYSLTYSRDM